MPSPHRTKLSAVVLAGLTAVGLAASLPAQEQPAPERPAPQPDGAHPADKPGSPEVQAADDRLPSELLRERLRKPDRPPATLPAAKELREQMPKLFADLANADPAVRENARFSLMGLSQEDLKPLQTLVRDNLPLVPSQAAVLREIVTHIFLSGQKYEADQRKGFLGVRLMQVSTVSWQEGQPRNVVVEENPFDPRLPLLGGPPTTGVLIAERMPGFCGARSLLDGDVVLSVVERPGDPVRNPDEMKLAVTSFRAGETIHFQLLRQGQVMQVPVTLDPSPDALDQMVAGFGAMQVLLDERKEQAAKYWDEAFAPMLREAAG